MSGQVISLGPPRNPTGNATRDRNWTLVVSRGTTVDHVQLHGTRSGDPEGAQAEADRYLGQAQTWEPCGPGYRAKETLPSLKGIHG